MADVQKAKEAIKKVETGGNKENSLNTMFEKMRGEFMKVLPATIKPDRLFRIAMTEMRLNPKLFDASKESLLGALMLSAQLGLEPGPLGYCYLVPYNNKRTGQLEIQFQLGYRGILELVRRSGQVESIEARVVYEKDRFDFSFGLEPKLIHKPALRDHGKPICVYAIARFKSGGYVFDVMSVEEIEQIRKRSKSADNGPWQTDWEAMAKKTIIKRLCKYLPLSTEVQKGLAVDETTKAVSGSMQDEEEILYQQDLTDWDNVVTIEEVPQEKEVVIEKEEVAQQEFKNPFVKE